MYNTEVLNALIAIIKNQFCSCLLPYLCFVEALRKLYCLLMNYSVSDKCERTTLITSIFMHQFATTTFNNLIILTNVKQHYWKLTRTDLSFTVDGCFKLVLHIIGYGLFHLYEVPLQLSYNTKMLCNSC